MLLQELIRRLIELLAQQEGLPPALLERSRELQERLASGRLHLAVLGQFKRGKSSLINALLGAEVLPQGVLPVTLIPIFLRSGSRPEIQVVFEDGRTEIHPPASLKDFVSEIENPRNQKGVQQVDVSYPSPLLRQGIVLIDTPGVGSTHQHNTEATLVALPRFDAGIVVLSADPPITAAEVEFLRQICQHVTHLFFVLNKIDYLKRSGNGDSRGAAEAEQFLRQVLESNLDIAQPEIFLTSALQGLEARTIGDPALWEASGMASFETALLELARHGRAAVLEQAIRRKTQNVAAEADHLLALRQQALRLPLADLEQSIETFQEYAGVARQNRQEVKDRLAGDEKRLRAFLEETIEALRQRTLPELERMASEAGIPTRDSRRNEAFQQVVGEVFDREREEVRRQVIRELNDVLAAREEEAQAIREQLRQEASDLLAIPHSPLRAEESRVEISGPAWTLKRLSLNLEPGFGEGLLPRSMRAGREAERRRRLTRELTVRNAEKIRWWLRKTVDESLKRFQFHIEGDMEETIRQIDDTLQIGRERHRLGIGEMEAVVDRLDRNRAELRELIEALESSSQIVPDKVAGEA